MSLAVALSAPCAAQISSAVDTSRLGSDGKAVHVAWLRYLGSKDNNWSTNAGVPSTLWLEREQRRWPMYDLAAFYLWDGSAATVASIEPVLACGQSVHRITTVYRMTQGDAEPWWKEIRETVYAVRRDKGWAFSNALLFNTCDWTRRKVGALNFIYSSSHPFDNALAHRGAAFVDSLAKAFSLPAIDSVDYYLTSSLDDVYRIIGLESGVLFDTLRAGFSQPRNRQMFSGGIGESYRHELAHLVLCPRYCSRSYFLSEGAATWAGGMVGKSFGEVTRDLAVYLLEHPKQTLDSILNTQGPKAQFYAAGAVVIDMVFERRGIAGVREFLDTGPSNAELRTAIARSLEMPWDAVERNWRARVLRANKR